jgi:hypothetical protein
LGEVESHFFDIVYNNVRAVSFLTDPTGSPLIISVNDSIAASTPPPPGPTPNVSSGIIPGHLAFEGWFIGQSINFDTGVVSSPYDGIAYVDDGYINVEVVPSPIALGGVGVMAGFTRKLRTRIRKGLYK